MILPVRLCALPIPASLPATLTCGSCRNRLRSLSAMELEHRQGDETRGDRKGDHSAVFDRRDGMREGEGDDQSEHGNERPAHKSHRAVDARGKRNTEPYRLCNQGRVRLSVAHCPKLAPGPPHRGHVGGKNEHDAHPDTDGYQGQEETGLLQRKLVTM